MRILNVGSIAVFVSFLGFLSPSSAFCDGHLAPMIEVGPGVEAPLQPGTGMNLLLRVNLGMRYVPDSERTLVGEEQMVWAHISGDLSFSFNPASPSVLPYLDIQFFPVHNQIGITGENGLSVMHDLAVLPTQIGRDIRINESLRVSVALAGVQFGMVRSQNENLAIFAQIAADALGYKLASYITQQGTQQFHGVHLTRLAAEGGVAILPSENFMIRIVLGGSGDINLGGMSGSFSAQSDMKTYLAVKADVHRFVQFYIQCSYNATCTSGNSNCLGYPQLGGGATFLFQ